MGCGSLPYLTDNFQINKYDNCRTNYESLDTLLLYKNLYIITLLYFMVELFDGETVILTNPVEATTLLRGAGHRDGQKSGIVDAIRNINNLHKDAADSDKVYVVSKRDFMDVKLHVGSIVLTNFRIILLTPDGSGLAEGVRKSTFKAVFNPPSFRYIFYNIPAFLDIAKKIATKNKAMWTEKMNESKKPSPVKISALLQLKEGEYSPYISILNKIGYEKNKMTKYIFQSVTKETISEYSYDDWDNYYFQVRTINIAKAEESLYLEDNNHKFLSATTKGILQTKYRLIIKPSKNEQSNWKDFINIMLDYVNRPDKKFSTSKEYRDAYMDIFRSV